MIGKPNWKDSGEEKVYIMYFHYAGYFETDYVYLTQNVAALPYMKNEEIAKTIIKEMQDELKLVFEV